VIYELLVTSAKRGLQAGRSGFSAVLRTHGMHPELQSRLESLSGYRHLFPQGDPRNPVIQSHSTIDSVAGKFSVFSRTVDAGSDYSGRSNKLSHHLAFDASEIRNAARSSPAAVLQCLQSNGRFASRWEGDPREQEPVSSIVFPPSEPAKCVAWESIGGDAGWAGMLVDLTLKGVSTWIIVPADVDPVGLLVEAMALMEPSKRWAVSFTTHAMSDAGFAWKVAVEGSAEAKVAREQNAATVIDLTRPAAACDDRPYVQAARGLGEVPWKKSTATKPVNPGAPRSPVRFSVESHEGTVGDRHHPETAAPPTALRPTPPPLLKPPPVVRPPDVLANTMLVPSTAGGAFVDRRNTALIAAAITVGVTVAVLLGLLVDVQIRGEGSVIRKVASLIPPEQGEKESWGDDANLPDKHAAQNSPRAPEGNKDTEQTAEQAKPHDSLNRGRGASAEAAGPAAPSQASAKEINQNPGPVKETAATTPLPQALEEPSTSGAAGPSATGADAGKPAVEAAFEPVREAVALQHHLPKQPLVHGAKDAAVPRNSASTLVAFKEGSSPPLIENLVLLPATGQLTLEACPRQGEESRWTCRTAGDSNAPVEVGTFVLNAKGISFETAATRQDAVERLAGCCLLILGKNTSEATYLQLSGPIEVAPIPFMLEHRQEDPRGVLQSQVHLPLRSVVGLDAGQEYGDVSLRITGATAPDAPPFTLFTYSFKPPLAGQQAVCFAVEQAEARLQVEYQVTAGTDSLSLELVAGPFADQAQFDRLCKAISSGGNVNFEHVFWPFVRSELLKAIPKAEEREAGGKVNDPRQTRVLGSLQETLKPPKKAAAPFATYVESLRNALLTSPSLLAKAGAIVDKRHPLAPPEQKKGEPDGSDKEKKDKDVKPSFDRDAEVTKEKESQFPVWCEERLSQLIAQRRKSAAPDGAKWTDDDLEDYAALFIWSRIQHLEQCVKVFKLPEVPAAMTGTVRCELRRIWPISTLPQGVSCRPETVLWRTTP
jgi:hypothetical protein